MFLTVLQMCAKLSPMDYLMNWSKQSIIVCFKLCNYFSQVKMVILCITNRFRDGPKLAVPITKISSYLSALLIKGMALK